jgi:hypothetical protein
MTTSFKSVNANKVNTGMATNLAGARQNLQDGRFCVLQPGNVVRDVYGRPVSQNTIKLNDTACEARTKFTTNNFLNYECIERPYTQAGRPVECNVANRRPAPKKPSSAKTRTSTM